MDFVNKGFSDRAEPSKKAAEKEKWKLEELEVED